MNHTTKIFGVLLLAAFALAATGCARPNARFIRTHASFATTIHEVDVVAFDAEIVVSGCNRCQLMFEARLQDRDGRAVAAPGDQFRIDGGQIAAARSFRVVSPSQRFDELSVSIPTSRMEVSVDREPIIAALSIYDASGRILAETHCFVPTAVRRTVARRNLARLTSTRLREDPDDRPVEVEGSARSPLDAPGWGEAAIPNRRKCRTGRELHSIP